MEEPDLDEMTVRSLAYELLPARLGRKWKEPADLYLLVRYGDDKRDIKPNLTLYALSKRLKRPETTLRLWLGKAREVLDPEIARRRAVAVVLCGKPPAESGLNFGDTIAFGHEAETRIDTVEETVVLGKPIPMQDWTPGMGPGKERERKRK